MILLRYTADKGIELNKSMKKAFTDLKENRNRKITNSGVSFRLLLCSTSIGIVVCFFWRKNEK